MTAITIGSVRMILTPASSSTGGWILLSSTALDSQLHGRGAAFGCIDPHREWWFTAPGEVIVVSSGGIKKRGAPAGEKVSTSMVVRGTQLPDKIEPDAILEAIFELRFDSALSLPEVLFGRLAEMPAWQTFTQKRLPAYDVPATFRESEPNLRFAPVFELAPPEGRRAVRVGAHVLSYHCLAPYVGWDSFSTDFTVAADGLFAKAERVTVHRLGLRYINALTVAAHGIRSVSDLDLEVRASQERLTDRLNLNFTTGAGPNTQCTIRVATREFVQGPSAADATVFVDVDVATTDGFRTDNVDAVKGWATDARRTKNQAFLGLLNAETLRRLGRAK